VYFPILFVLQISATQRLQYLLAVDIAFVTVPFRAPVFKCNSGEGSVEGGVIATYMNISALYSYLGLPLFSLIVPCNAGEPRGIGGVNHPILEITSRGDVPDLIPSVIIHNPQLVVYLILREITLHIKECEAMSQVELPIHPDAAIPISAADTTCP